MTRLTLENLVANKELVMEYARKSGNPLFAKPLKDLDVALTMYSESLEKLLMAVKLADDNELHDKILDMQRWKEMSPSERQMHRIKKGLWRIGTPEEDGL